MKFWISHFNNLENLHPLACGQEGGAGEDIRCHRGLCKV